METRPWLWPVLLVGSLLLATLPGVWISTDQAYAFAAARRLVEAGSFVLTGPGQVSAPDLPWIPPGPQGEVRTQIHPLVPVLLAPLAWLDSRLGLWGPDISGTFVHALNPVLIVLAVMLAGRRLWRETRRYDATAFVVLATGVLWPTYQVARRGMAEPLLILLLTMYVCALPDRSFWVRGLALALLPWAHPTGLVLAAALGGLDVLRQGRAAWREAIAGAASTLLFLGMWNYAFHGHWLKGGYASLEPSGGAFSVHSAWSGIGFQLAEVLGNPMPLAATLVVGSAHGRWERLRDLAPGYLALLTLLLLFSTHYFRVPGEPTRHLAVVWPMVHIGLARAWPTQLWARRLLWGLLVAQAVLSIHWFFRFDGRYWEGPAGLFYPGVLWVKLAIDGRPGLAALGLLPALFALVALLATLRSLAKAASGEADMSAPLARGASERASTRGAPTRASS